MNIHDAQYIGFIKADTIYYIIMKIHYNSSTSILFTLYSVTIMCNIVWIMMILHSLKPKL